MSGTCPVECGYRTAHFGGIVLGQSEQGFGLIQQCTSIAEDDIMVVGRIVPEDAFGIDIDIFAPDVVRYGDVSVARCLTVYGCPMQVSTLMKSDQLIVEHARIILDGVIEALVTVLVHKVIDLHVRSVAVCLICQAVVIQLLGIYSHVGYVGIG